MKKIVFCFMVLCMGFNPVYAGEPLKISAPSFLNASTSEDRLNGPIIELVRQIFAEFNVEIEPISLPWARAVAQMKTGELDMIPVIFYTRDRAEAMVFTIPYMDVPTAVFVPLGKCFEFNTLDDLQGRNGLMIRGDSISEEFNAYRPKLTISEVPAYEQMLKMLDTFRADYAVAAEYGFMIEARRMGYDRVVEKLPRPIASRELHFAFSKKSMFQRYLPEVNQRIIQLQKDGTMDRLIETAIRLASE